VAQAYTNLRKRAAFIMSNSTSAKADAENMLTCINGVAGR